jgi:hypothetical protein
MSSSLRDSLVDSLAEKFDRAYSSEANPIHMPGLNVTAEVELIHGVVSSNPDTDLIVHSYLPNGVVFEVLRDRSDESGEPTECEIVAHVFVPYSNIKKISETKVHGIPYT